MSFSPSNQPFKDDIELKSDLRSDTLDTRQEYDLKVRSHRCQKHLRMSVQEWVFFKTLEKSTISEARFFLWANRLFSRDVFCLICWWYAGNSVSAVLSICENVRVGYLRSNFFSAAGLNCWSSFGLFCLSLSVQLWCNSSLWLHSELAAESLQDKTQKKTKTP